MNKGIYFFGLILLAFQFQAIASHDGVEDGQENPQRGRIGKPGPLKPTLANDFDCNSKDTTVKVHYSTSTFLGQPSLSYTKNSKTQNFRGPQISHKMALGVQLDAQPEQSMTRGILELPVPLKQGDFSALFAREEYKSDLATSTLVKREETAVSCKGQTVFFLAKASVNKVDCQSADGKLKINYNSSGVDGQPSLSYSTEEALKQFRGQDIRNESIAEVSLSSGNKGQLMMPPSPVVNKLFAATFRDGQDSEVVWCMGQFVMPVK